MLIKHTPKAIAERVEQERAVSRKVQPLVRYEYAFKRINGTCINSTNTIESLNRLGAEGWQLAGSLRSNSGGFGGLFVRANY